MLALKMLLTVVGAVLLTTAFGIPLYALWLRFKNARHAPAEGEIEARTGFTEWGMPIALAIGGMPAPLLAASGIVVVPSGMGGVRTARSAERCRGRCIPGCTSLLRWWTTWRCSICAITCLLAVWRRKARRAQR